jgi:hypothetical protein
MTVEASDQLRTAANWQWILADLALILFLVALTGLPAAEAGTAAPAPAAKPARARPAEIAAAQALYRPLRGGPALGDWLKQQQRDPRATLTIFAAYGEGGEGLAWAAARRLAAEAAAADAGLAVRVIIAPGPAADLYASLAYDRPLTAARSEP